MPKLRVVESGICNGNGGFERGGEGILGLGPAAINDLDGPEESPTRAGPSGQAVRKTREAVEKLPSVSESLRCAKKLYFHYYKRASFCLSL